MVTSPGNVHDEASSTRILDRCLFAFWTSSLIAFVVGTRLLCQSSMDDCLVLALAHCICLPLIHRNTPLALIPPLGCAVVGMAIGFQLVDLGFDMLIIWGRSVHDGLDALSGRRVAWLYYNTMLNAQSVNLGIAVFLLVGQFGAVVGLSRSLARARRQWRRLVFTMIAGNGGYMISVVPRYVAIWQSAAFDEGFFDGWRFVVLARVYLFVALGAALVILCSLLLDDLAKDNGKSHVQ